MAMAILMVVETANADGKHYANSNNGAMTSLDISNNRLEAEGAKHIAAALPECK